MIVLASKSPRRKELMEKFVTSSFLIDPSEKDEIVNKDTSPIENVKSIAKQKGDDVFLRHPNDLIISADTIVVFNSTIYGKPKDKEDAKRILSILSNNDHEVITAFYIRNKDKTILKSVTSKVTFHKLSSDFIDRYIDTGIPMDKAGAYAIQGEYGKDIVKSYKGSLSNIIGFPYEEILEALKEFKL